jgi:hypothetical protein
LDIELTVKMSNLKTRIALVALTAVLALSAVVGAITVVAGLPREWIAASVFPDYTVPELALGVLVGGGVVIAAVAVIYRPRFGAAAAVGSAVMIIGFEVVEIAAVGFSSLTYGIDKPQSWLQVAFLAQGAVIGMLGAGLWRALGGRIPRLGNSPRPRRRPYGSRAAMDD